MVAVLLLIEANVRMAEEWIVWFQKISIPRMVTGIWFALPFPSPPWNFQLHFILPLKNFDH